MTAETPTTVEEERGYLARSLEDLEREHAAGDLDEEHYRVLRERYENRARELEARVAEAPDAAPGKGSAGASPSTPRRSRRPIGPTWLSSRRSRVVTGWGGLGCFVVAAVLLTMSIAKVGPFAAATPLTVRDRVQIELAEAAVLGAKGDVSQAVITYNRVLQLDPSQPEALTDGGWLARLEGLSKHSAALVRSGDAEIDAAVRIEPGSAEARAYDGVVDLQDRSDPRGAASEFSQMLADHAAPTLIASIRADALLAFDRAHEKVPAQFR